MVDIKELLKRAAAEGISDIFIRAKRPVSFKKDGVIIPGGGEEISFEETASTIRALYEMAGRSTDLFESRGDDDFSVSLVGSGRFRVNVYRQRGSMAAIIRVVLFDIPDYRDLKIAESVMDIANEKNGLVLVTGAAGSGKTTTLACIIDKINKTRNAHIITLEDPIEFLHRDNKSLISQREIVIDTESYLSALRACMRQTPDIILLGEMRDHETIQTVMTAAETGHLIISTLHTAGAVNTIDRVVDVFPPAQQQQVRVQLSMLLRVVVTQQLLPAKNGGLLPAFEIMRVNNGIRNLIRESKIHQIDNMIQTSSGEGMISMDMYIFKMFQNGEITGETAVNFAVNGEQMARKIKG